MIYKEYQPLRVSGDWKFEWNCFFEVDPSENTMSYFTENLLLLNSAHRKRSIELQWQPENNPNGNYILKVINLQEDFNKATNSIINVGDWGNPYLVFKSKKRLEIVSKLEELMFVLDAYKDERILESKGVVNETLEALRIEFLEQGYSEKLAEKICVSKNANLQNLLLDSKNIKKERVLFLSENGAKKGIKNKAKQLLNSKKFH
ncbi:hypothetical protein [Polaribacter sp.]|uniref:hypothetical protein n=1 Tax=Polaribacter sp. TaxID=1920175 RepID=UPI003F6D0F60